MNSPLARKVAFVSLGAAGALAVFGGGAALVYFVRRASRFEDAETRAQERLRDVAIPTLATARLPRVSPSLRVVIRRSGLALDHTAVAASWSPRDRAAVLSRLDEVWSEAMPVAWENVVPIVQDDVPAAFRRGGEFGYLIPPLSERLSDVRMIEQAHTAASSDPRPSTVTVYADANLRSRAIFSALYTLGQGDYSTFHLAAHTGRGEGVVVINAPRIGAPPDELALTVQVRDDGYMIGARGGWIQPDCHTVGAATLTIPDPRAALVGGDATALTRCAATLRTALHDDLQGHSTINVSPQKQVTYGALLRAIYALREETPGACEAGDEAPGCMFPDVRLGILR